MTAVLEDMPGAVADFCNESVKQTVVEAFRKEGILSATGEQYFRLKLGDRFMKEASDMLRMGAHGPGIRIDHRFPVFSVHHLIEHFCAGVLLRGFPLRREHLRGSRHRFLALEAVRDQAVHEIRTFQRDIDRRLGSAARPDHIDCSVPFLIQQRNRLCGFVIPQIVRQGLDAVGFSAPEKVHDDNSAVLRIFRGDLVEHDG